jgi:hypothetical protein
MEGYSESKNEVGERGRGGGMKKRLGWGQIDGRRGVYCMRGQK